MMTFFFNGVEISEADFPRTLAGWVAFSIAFANNTYCSDKDAAVELLLFEAAEIIKTVKTGKRPEGGDIR